LVAPRPAFIVVTLSTDQMVVVFDEGAKSVSPASSTTGGLKNPGAGWPKALYAITDPYVTAANPLAGR
jgi:hypothetical protein